MSNAITATNTNVPAANSGDSNIPVTSPAGCTASVSNWGGGSQWFNIKTSPGAGSSNLVITQVNNVSNTMKPATVTLTNKMAGGANTTVTVTPTLAGPTLAPASSTINNFYLNIAQSATFTASAPGGITDANSSNSAVATVRRNGSSFTVTAVNLGTANITVSNGSSPGATSTYKITVASPRNYVGKAVWSYYGFYIAPEDAGTSKWTSSLTSTHCANKSGATWFVPNVDQWRVLLGGTLGYDNASAAVFNEYKNQGVFATGKFYWASAEYSSGIAYYLDFGSSNTHLDAYDGSVLNQVRCVSK